MKPRTKVLDAHLFVECLHFVPPLPPLPRTVICALPSQPLLKPRARVRRLASDATPGKSSPTLNQWIQFSRRQTVMYSRLIGINYLGLLGIICCAFLLCGKKENANTKKRNLRHNDQRRRKLAKFVNSIPPIIDYL